MKKLKRAALFLSAALLLFVFAPFVPADFGDYAGDSDYGYDDYDSYDYDDDDYDYDDDDDGWFFGGSGSSGGSGGKSSYYSFGDYPAEDVYYGAMRLADSLGRTIRDGTLSTEALRTPGDDDSGAALVGLALLLGTAAIVTVVILRARSRRGARRKRKVTVRSTGHQNTRSVAPGAQPTPQIALQNISEYYRLDPDFSEAELSEKIANWYVRFQNAWQARDLEELRPCLTDAFYAQMDRQMAVYRQKKQTPHMERIAVLGVTLSGWRQRGGEDLMTARLRTRIVDYVTDDATGKIVRGSDTAERFMEYEWTLTRKTGVTTTAGGGVRVQNCPNCGGTVNINRTAKCPYCDSIITVDSSDWAVSEIKGLSQRTGKR